MRRIRKTIAAACVTLIIAMPVYAEGDRAAYLDGLFAELLAPETENWERVEQRILDEFSKSGSRTADLLLERGRDALEQEEYRIAVEHFTALTDHAPEFAEGWNGRATAFFHMEEFGLSIADISQTLALNPRHFEALTGLGLILERLEEYDAALAAYREAEALNPRRDIIQDGVERLVRQVEGRDI